jgi:energy-dependent translational throttle protein EttA
MAQYVYTMNRVGKIVPPKREILKDISLSFFPGAKIGVLGLNGSGKSSLLRIMAGVDKDYRRRGARPARHQDRLPAAGAAARSGQDGARGSRIRTGGGARGKPEARRDLCRLRRARCRLRQARGTAGALRSRDRRRRHRCRDADGNRRRRAAPAAVGCRIEKLSGGEKRRIALCKLLLSKPDMLLLDEPTNHLDAESVDWLEQFLARFPGTVVAITHDRYFLDNAAEWILELDRGHGIPWKGNYSSWLEQKEPAAGAGIQDRGGARQDHEAGTGVGAQQPEGTPGQEQGAPEPLRGTVQRRLPEAQRDPGDLHPGRRTARRTR